MAKRDKTKARKELASMALVRIGGVCGPTPQAVGEAELLASLGYHAGLLSLAALRHASDDELVAHCRSVGQVLPIVGFYLQPAVGGRVLSLQQGIKAIVNGMKAMFMAIVILVLAWGLGGVAGATGMLVTGLAMTRLRSGPLATSTAAAGGRPQN